VRKRRGRADRRVEIPFSQFRNCDSGRCFDPSTSCLRGSGSASDRLERLGVLEQTEFRSVNKERLAAEAAARRRELEQCGSRGR
jgi:hypothetical protein